MTLPLAMKFFMPYGTTNELINIKFKTILYALLCGRYYILCDYNLSEREILIFIRSFNVEPCSFQLKYVCVDISQSIFHITSVTY